jgi:hypothetical protein
MSSLIETAPPLGTRAVLRRVVPGSAVPCTTCGEIVRYAARAQHQQVIANVYVDGRWNRVEHHHDTCYQDAGEPHGPPAPPPRR